MSWKRRLVATVKTNLCGYLFARQWSSRNGFWKVERLLRAETGRACHSFSLKGDVKTGCFRISCHAAILTLSLKCVFAK